MNAECTEKVPDVVAHRLEAEVELPGDLLGRLASLQQA
jgi:hypothetical protein